MNKKALGVDIGKVIIDHRRITKEEAKLLGERYSEIPATKDVFTSLKRLNDERFFGNIFLVSKVKEEHENRTTKWLRDNDFFNKTGIVPENVCYCRERSDKEKICRDNNITHFIDDRLEVLSHMIGKVPNLYLFHPDPKEVEEFKQFLPNVTRVESWEEVNSLML
jgi:hypothetical protein